MPENDCPINGVNCVSIARVEALERALEAQKQHSSLAREKIYGRLGELERGMETVVAAIITGAIGYLLASIGIRIG